LLETGSNIYILVHYEQMLNSPNKGHQQPLTTPAAFGRDHLLSERWLLGSIARGADGLWYSVLEVTPAKQELFLDRVLFLQLAVSRVSASATNAVRLTAQQWDAEVELACLGSWVLLKMEEAKDDQGTAIFSIAALKMCRARFIEGYLVSIHSQSMFFY
jgi:hypothetical protein